MANDVVDLTSSDPADVLLTLVPSVLGGPLEDAISSAEHRRITSTLRTICLYSPQARGIAERLLLVEGKHVRRDHIERACDEDGVLLPDDEAGGDSESEDDADEVERTSGGMKKVPRPRFATCINCNQEFDVTKNEEVDCQWHTGEKEADRESDTWADDDEDCHWDIDELEDEYPKGFTWTCCDRSGDTGGCRIGTHLEAGSMAKRRWLQ